MTHMLVSSVHYRWPSSSSKIVAWKYCLFSISTKLTLFQAYCAPNIHFKSLVQIKTSELVYKKHYSHIQSQSQNFTYYQDLVQFLCLPQTIRNLSMNTLIHPYLAFYVVFIRLKTLFLFVTSIRIYIYFRSSMYTYRRSQLYIWYLYCIFV